MLGADPVVATIGIAIVLLFVADWIFKFEAVLPIMTPVLLIGGMASGIFTPTEAAVAASIWALFLGLVWYRTLSVPDVHQGLDGNDRDHGGRAVHRRRRVDLRLAAHRDARDRHGDRVGAVVHATSRGCSCCW